MNLNENEEIIEEVIESNDEEKPKGLTPTFTQKEKKKNSIVGKAVVKYIAIITLSITAGFGGAFLYNKMYPAGTNNSAIIYQSVDRNVSQAKNRNDELSIPQIVEMVENSVVEIKTETSSSFRGAYVREGAGSGVIITANGYIVTNNHVIEGTNKVYVTLKNGEVYDAVVIGRDILNDLAVVKIEETNLTPAILGDSDSLVVGELAIAIGNPLGSLGGTVTNGIISSLSRNISIDGIEMNLLQTNSAVNPGNSGGGLFNGYGELIGVVNAKSMGSDIEGLGFAIPVNAAREVIEEIMSNGYISGKARLGISIIEIKTDLEAQEYGVKDLGTYIYAIEEGSAAMKAGLKEKDLILAINDKVVETSAEIRNEINKHEVNEEITITILRDKKMITVTAVLQETIE